MDAKKTKMRGKRKNPKPIVIGIKPVDYEKPSFMNKPLGTGGDMIRQK